LSQITVQKKFLVDFFKKSPGVKYIKSSHQEVEQQLQSYQRVVPKDLGGCSIFRAAAAIDQTAIWLKKSRNLANPQNAQCFLQFYFFKRQFSTNFRKFQKSRNFDFFQPNVRSKIKKKYFKRQFSTKN